MILWGILQPKPHLRYRTGSETAPVLVLARSAPFLHAVAGTRRGQVGVVVKSHWGLCSGFHATGGFVPARWDRRATHV